jgi:hypothetical protein
MPYKDKADMEEFNSMVEAQEGKCAICKEIPRPRKIGYEESPWHVDHDHKTGQVRALTVMWLWVDSATI